MAARRGPRRGPLWTAFVLLALAASYFLDDFRLGVAEPEDTGRIEQLYAAQQSGVVVEDAGVVFKVLPDDRKGSRHQRFLLRLGSGHSLLVSHNIDLADRVANLARGDEVQFRGQYEWNERGGVVHWTHHDPDGRRPGGWLEHAGRTYR